MENSSYTFKKGDCIATSLPEGLWGIAVVLSEPQELMTGGKKLSPFCHIMITPLIFRHKPVITDIEGVILQPLVFNTYFRFEDGSRVQYRAEICIDLYASRNKANLPVIGTIDTDGLYDGELSFSPQWDRFHIYGYADENLGRRAYINMQRKYEQGMKIDDDITFIPYYPDADIALPWYQDAELCRQVDNREHVYSAGLLSHMYTYLSENGDCFYIRYKDTLVGDITLRDSGEICIVICREYQNRHIGRRCVNGIIALAKENGFQKLSATIYSFNAQSRKMFEAAGFVNVSGDDFIYHIR